MPAPPWCSAPPASRAPIASGLPRPRGAFRWCSRPTCRSGINVLLRLVADAARALGPGYDIEILEAHHRQKRDAPSGTALRLAEALAEATGRDLEQTARYARHGDIGAAHARARSACRPCAAATWWAITPSSSSASASASRSPTAPPRARPSPAARSGPRCGWPDARPGLYDMRDVLGYASTDPKTTTKPTSRDKRERAWRKRAGPLVWI